MYYEDMHNSKDAPTLKGDEAKEYARAVMNNAAYHVVDNTYRWAPRGMDYSQKRRLWAFATPAFKSKVATYAGKQLCNKLKAATGINKNIKAGSSVITQVACEEAVRECIADQASFQSLRPEDAVDVPKAKEEEATEPTLAAMNYNEGEFDLLKAETAGRVIAAAVTADLIKERPVRSLEDVYNFLPRRAEDVELFKSHGIVPEGYLSVEELEDISLAGCRIEYAAHD